MKPRVTLYTRAGCHLCEEARRAIKAARARADFDYQEVDIDGHDCEAGLLRRYNHEVPVIAIDGVKAFKYRVEVNELLKKLEARA
jgi:glutaredoxin